MDRYHRQVAFWGAKNQARLGRKSAAIVGVGAVGSVAAELLARAGLGRLVLYDSDTVDITNLQRQSLYDEEDVNVPKVAAAKEKLGEINSTVIVDINMKRIGKGFKTGADIILDCTDNLEARFVINQYCKKAKKPWVHSAAAGSIGVVLPVTKPGHFDKVYGKINETLTCTDMGVINSATYTTASIQVTEAIKILLGKKPVNGMIRFDLWKGKFEVIKV